MDNTHIIVDSHAHLNMEEFDKDRSDVVERAFSEGIGAILCPVDLAEPERLNIAEELENSFDNIILAAGVHPHMAKDFEDIFLDQIKKLAAKRKIKAIGEIGLDFHYNLSDKDSQVRVFREQLNIAQELELPVIIHSRNAQEDILRAVKEEGFSQGGVLHCFTEEWDLARQMMDEGFFISFSGILTFPKAGDIRETAKKIPLERLLVETDAPYLTPVPFRGKIRRNEPLYVRETGQFLASLKNISYEELSDQTTQNFSECFMFEIKKTE
ncbi:TatD family hydrolase [Acidobacteriota bacterium]